MKCSSVIVTITITILLGVLILCTPVRDSREADAPVLKIIVSTTGLNTISVGTDADPMPPHGLQFTVNVTLTGTTNMLMTYQIAVKYNRTAVNCTAAWIDKNDPSFVFHTKRNEPLIIPDAAIDGDIGYFFLGASLTGDDSVSVSSGLMCQANFTMLRRGNYSIDVIPDGDLEYPDSSFLLNNNQNDIAFTMESLAVTSLCGPSTPVALFSFQPQNPAPSVSVTFNAGKSYDPYGNITLYMWNYGDGTEENGTEATTSHAFASLGAYWVNLTVMNDFAFNPAYNYSGSNLNEIQVGQIPQANFTYSPFNPRELVEVTFDASQSTAPSGTINSYIWNFDDGTENTTVNPMTDHTFMNKGVYSVMLTVYDNNGLHGSISTAIQIGGIPTASFTFSPVNPDVDETVTFDATASKAADQGDTIASYVWDFGDANVTQINSLTPNAATPQHVYVSPDTYSVNLTVYDNHGLFNSNVQSIKVGHEAPPDYTLYIVTGVTIAVLVTIAALVFWRRSRPKRHTPKPGKSSTK